MFSLQVNSSAFSPDGQMLLTASEDGCVYGWKTQSGHLLWKLGGHTGGASARMGRLGFMFWHFAEPTTLT